MLVNIFCPMKTWPYQATDHIEFVQHIPTRDAFIGGVINRLSGATIFEVEGWKRITNLVQRFRNYNVNSDDVELLFKKVYHPHIFPKDDMKKSVSLNVACSSGKPVVVTLVTKCNSNDIDAVF